MRWIVFVIVCITILGIQVKALSHGLRIVCYFDYSAVYNGIFDLKKDLEPALDKCTHLAFLHAVVDRKSFKVAARNPEQDIDMGGYKRSVAVKKKFPHLSVMLVIGGWKGASETFSNLAKTEETRSIFINSTVEFLKHHSFDGMELRWFFPGDFGSDPEDKENLVLLSKELKEEFDKNGLIYGLVASGRRRRIEDGIDAERLSEFTHFISITTVDYHLFREGVIGASGPIYSEDELSIDFSIQQYLKMGADPGKLNMAISSFFTNFMLREPLGNISETTEISGLPSRRTESFLGLVTKTPGYIAYNEACALLESESNWTITTDTITKIPFAIESHRVIAMENEQTLSAKVKYAMEQKLGGITYFSLDKDDFKQTCKSSKEKYPMLTLLDKALNESFRLLYDEFKLFTKKESSQYFWGGMKQ